MFPVTSFVVICLLFIFSLTGYAGAPNPLKSLPDSPACKDFFQFTIGQMQNTDREPLEKDNVFFTDQVMINHDGNNVFAWSDGLYKIDSLHHMWSASKSITTTLIGAALQQQPLMANGSHFNEQTRLLEIFGEDILSGDLAKQKEKFAQVNVENLVNMTSGLLWNEGYETEASKSTFLWMLYGKGRKDMVRFVLSQGMDRFDVGTHWNYSGGNMLLGMGLLKRIYGVRGNELAKRLLFDKIGIKKGFYESDQRGTMVGSSYLHLTPKEMVQLGLLYLNNGIVNGERLLSENWIQQAQVPSAGLAHSNDMTAEELEKYKKYVKDEGLHSNRSFWLNQDYPDLDFTHEFPNSPRDMYFAAGHYGQLIIIIPSQKMVIARTGHDKFYWDKIDRFTSKAVACFGNPETARSIDK